MDMTVVIGIFTFIFFVSLSIMCFYRSKINIRFWNKVFIAADVVVYSCWVYASYQRGWLRDGWPTLENISPLMFTVMLLLPFFNDKVKKYAYSAFAALNVGMFVAMLVSPEHEYLFNFKTEATFEYTAEAVCHMLCSLYGIYLVLSHQVKPDFKAWVRSMAFIYPIITLGVITNFVYHKNNFGMDPYGTASIYMIDIFDGFWATLVAYYFGVALVLTIGIQAAGILDVITAKFIDKHSDSECLDTDPCIEQDATCVEGKNTDEKPEALEILEVK